MHVAIRTASALLTLGLASHGWAANQPVEEVVVTGSYIAGSPEDAASPVQTVTRDDIIASGVSDIGELVRNLEIASGSDTAPADGARFNGQAGNGLANVNLRGLGPTATLVLLDGKRLPFAGQKLSDGDRFVDINTIPITMIERVEILKDGGSALYGSDAIAGVVNFITRKNFEGFELSVKSQGLTEGSQRDTTVGGLFGWSSEDARSNIVIGGEYFDRTALHESDITDLARDQYPQQDGVIVNRSNAFVAIPGVRGAGDPLCGALGFRNNDSLGSDPQLCERGDSATDQAIPAQNRRSLMVVGSHAFNERIEVYTQLSWQNSGSGNKRPIHVGPIEPKFALPSLLGLTAGPGGTPVFAADPFTGLGGAPNDPSNFAFGGPLPAGTLLDPTTFAPIVAFPLDLVDYEARSPGIDPTRQYRAGNDSVTTRYQLGVRGDLEFRDRSWRYDASYTMGESEFDTRFLGLDKDRLELAHYGLGGPQCTPNGTLDPSDPRAATARFLLAGADGAFNSTAGAPGAVGPFESLVEQLTGTLEGFPSVNPDNIVLAMTSSNQGNASQGCFFFNPYLSRVNNPAIGNSEEMLRWLEVEMDPAQRSRTFQDVFDFVIAGELFDMPAGPVGLAIGAQYREEGRKTFVNQQTIGGINSFGQLSGGESVAGLSENRGFDSERDIKAVFLEVQVPLHSTLDMQLAARYEDYGGQIGDTFNPKLGLRFQPVESLVLRGSVSSSFRGPSLAQVAEGTGFSLEFGPEDALRDNCVRTGQCPIPTGDAVPAILAIVKRGDASPNLQPEEAVTFNGGFIWSPVEGPLVGAQFGMDFYLIEFKDKIIDVPTQAFLTQELGLFQTALAAGNFVGVDPTQAGFNMACNPSDAVFSDPTNAAFESCQVDPAAYAITAANSAFDGSITRRSDTTRSLQIIASQAINTGEVKTSGIDFSFGYVRDVGNLGTFALDSNFNWINEFEVSDFPVGQPDFDAAGFTNRDPERRLTRSMPDFRGNVALSWLRGNHTARLNMRYIGEYTDNAVLVLDEEQGPYYAFDLNYSLAIPMRDGAVTLSLGVIDLFDRTVPNVRDSRGVDLTVFDQRGRRVFGSIKYAL